MYSSAMQRIPFGGFPIFLGNRFPAVLVKWGGERNSSGKLTCIKGGFYQPEVGFIVMISRSWEGEESGDGGGGMWRSHGATSRGGIRYTR